MSIIQEYNEKYRPPKPGVPISVIEEKEWEKRKKEIN